jgi:hypothetical protein
VTINAALVSTYGAVAIFPSFSDQANDDESSSCPSDRRPAAFGQVDVDVVCRDPAARPLPLLVDVGGKPTPEQMALFDQCTGAIVLAPDAERRDE